MDIFRIKWDQAEKFIGILSLFINGNFYSLLHLKLTKENEQLKVEIYICYIFCIYFGYKK
jgi:hypothetical protein